VYNGDYKSLVINGSHEKEEIVSTAKELVTEYIEIVGQTSISAEINRKNSILNLNNKYNVLLMCERLSAMNMFDEVCEILKEFGYTVKSNDVQQKVKTILNSTKFFLDKSEREYNAIIKSGKRDKDHFYKEISIVMTHYKMSIDKERISAKEYAYIVKRMCEEIKEQNAAALRIKNKK
jgi:hypothetical protein